MPSRTAIASVVALLSLCVLPPGAAAKSWVASGARDFSAGKLDGVSVLSSGELILAPRAEQIEGVETQFVWDAETADDGTVYIATGAPSAVYRLKGQKAELVHKIEQKQVLSVLPLPDGSVLAGTAPNGVIYRISRHGKLSVFVDLEDAYVWDMVRGPVGRIYCATGPNGRLVELSGSGKPTELFKADQANLTCVAVDKEGTVYVGTSPGGYVYQIEHGRKVSVLYQAEEQEVHDLLIGPDGALYACTAQGQAMRGPKAPSLTEPGQSPGRSSTTTLPPSPSGERAGAATNSIYRIVPGKGALVMARFPSAFIVSMAASDGEVLAGTGPDGRLMAVRPDRVYRIVIDLDAAYIMAMAVGEDGDVIVGTSNPGRLWRLSKEGRASGTLLSKPFDAGYLSRWGRLSWKGTVREGQDIELKLRTGNAARPDEHWSDWSEPVDRPEGGAVNVPPGRFAQFAARLSAHRHCGSPTLLEVEVSYRQSNRPPRIEGLLIDGEDALDGTASPGRRPGGSGSQRPGMPALRRPERPRGQKELRWRVSDPNGDKLRFELYYRAEDELAWKRLAPKLREETSYNWDTSRVPDGYYRIKIVAFDDPSRPPEEALSEERISKPVLIDNTPPSVSALQARRMPDGSYSLTGLASDGRGRIASIEVSQNAGDWQAVFPDDGIFDSPEERFSFETDILEPGEHVFVFAATDAAGNVGSNKVVIEVPHKG